MIQNIVADGSVVFLGPVIIMIVFGFIMALVIVALIRLVRYLGNAGKEQQKIRLEMSKVADEVHQLRQNLSKLNDKGAPNSDAPTS